MSLWALAAKLLPMNAYDISQVISWVAVIMSITVALGIHTARCEMHLVALQLEAIAYE